jgi:hypothetical protein
MIEETATILKGENSRIEISPQGSGFRYVMFLRGEKVLEGDDYESYDDVVNNLSVLHEVLKEIFG